jgi:hypothetical protein
MGADVYAFGCLAYEVRTGSRLFQGAAATSASPAQELRDGSRALAVELAKLTWPLRSL